MSREYLEQQIREYLSQSHNMGFETQVAMLVNLIEKIIIVNSGNIAFKKSDIGHIVSMAKNIHCNLSLPVKVSNSDLDYSEINHFCMIMAVLDWLKLRDALKKQIEVEKK